MIQDRVRKSGGPCLRQQIIVGLLLLVVACSALAQEAGTISGKVSAAKTGDPIPSINVTVKGTSLGAATANDGTFEIKQVPAGTHRIVFSSIGSNGSGQAITSSLAVTGGYFLMTTGHTG